MCDRNFKKPALHLAKKKTPRPAPPEFGPVIMKKVCDGNVTGDLLAYEEVRWERKSGHKTPWQTLCKNRQPANPPSLLQLLCASGARIINFIKSSELVQRTLPKD